ncbi:hypothetical protein KAR91_73275 [Candidatus Pacearchaeota archaeon]|nr:hypothetical protein [Candidatus Pacearchaeota archaeon]
MKTLNLYFDFEFTSLSPDAQPISLGIVSDCIKPFDFMVGFKHESKSLYAEFSDFDINRCDDWVKENVVKKLTYPKEYKENPAWNKFEESEMSPGSWSGYGNTTTVKHALNMFLEQFSDYQIQFVCDCGTWDWYWMLQLLAEWETKPYAFEIDVKYIPNNMTLREFIEEMKANGNIITDSGATPHDGIKETLEGRIGLPKLPDNISPVPEDLNDLIARVKGISVREAFDLNREELAYGPAQVFVNDNVKFGGEPIQKHLAIWDAKVIKEIYQKLK